ncbi:MAG: HU family DNA-binding protein [Rhodocyclaceae bacterium]|nr:HU family DNA-binding protein [Rhodocyclaceae bacterium]
MNKSDLIELVQIKASASHARQISKAEVAAVLDALGDVAQETLGLDVEVPLPGLGKLATVTRKAREGRNPATGAAVHIPERTAVQFRPAKALRDAVNP